MKGLRSIRMRFNGSKPALQERQDVRGPIE